MDISNTCKDSLSLPKIFFTISTATLTALVLWVGSTLHSNQLALEKIKVETTYMREFMQNAFAHSQENSSRLNHIEKRLGKLEAKVGL